MHICLYLFCPIVLATLRMALVSKAQHLTLEACTTSKFLDSNADSNNSSFIYNTASILKPCHVQNMLDTYVITIYMHILPFSISCPQWFSRVHEIWPLVNLLLCYIPNLGQFIQNSQLFLCNNHHLCFPINCLAPIHKH